MAPNKPAQGQHVHTFACHDDLWAAVVARAQRDSMPASQVIRDALDDYLRTSQ